MNINSQMRGIPKILFTLSEIVLLKYENPFQLQYFEKINKTSAL